MNPTHSTLDDATALALAQLVARLDSPDVSPPTLDVAAAAARLAVPDLQDWSSEDHGFLCTTSVTVRGVSQSFLFEDVDYPHLFDPEQYVEAFAHDIEDHHERRVTLIFVGDEFLFRLRFRGHDEQWTCTAEITIARVEREHVAATVGLWEDQLAAELVLRATELLGGLPPSAGRRALLRLQTELAGRPGWLQA